MFVQAHVTSTRIDSAMACGTKTSSIARFGSPTTTALAECSTLFPIMIFLKMPSFPDMIPTMVFTMSKIVWHIDSAFFSVLFDLMPLTRRSYSFCTSMFA